MKISKYVKKIEFDDDQYLLRNLYNGAIYLIDKNEMDSIENMLQVNENISSYHQIPLEQELFLVENEPCQVYETKSDSFLLTVETSSFCNLNCTYCYENDKGTRCNISEDVIDGILTYVENIFLQDNNIKKICVAFIGGEPLLCKDSILYICDKMEILACKYNKVLSYHIDTNGTIPLSAIYDRLENLYVSVSLTPRSDHNKNRPAKDFDSFERIVNNLKDTKRNVKNTISLRYNTNDANISWFNEFVEFVKAELPACDVIVPMYTDEYPYTNFKNALKLEDFKKWNSSEAVDTLIENGFNVPYTLGGPLSSCVAYKKYSCKVYADGMVTICDSMPHKDARCSIFEICDNPELLQTYYWDIKQYNPLEDKECSECTELARCMGKIFCKEAPCNYNKRFDDDLLAITYTKYALKDKGSFFPNML